MSISGFGMSYPAFANRLPRPAIGITMLMMFTSGILLFLFANPLMRVFTNSDPVIRLGTGLLRMIAFTEPFFGLMIAIEGIFYGMGRTKEIFVVETFSMWGIRIVATFLCTRIWHRSLYAVWGCMIADNICKALLLLWVYHREGRRTGNV